MQKPYYDDSSDSSVEKGVGSWRWSNEDAKTEVKKVLAIYLSNWHIR